MAEDGNTLAEVSLKSAADVKSWPQIEYGWLKDIFQLAEVAFRLANVACPSAADVFALAEDSFLLA